MSTSSTTPRRRLRQTGAFLLFARCRGLRLAATNRLGVAPADPGRRGPRLVLPARGTHMTA